MVTTIALDAMGGDHGLDVVIPAALSVLKDDDTVQMIFVGDQLAITDRLKTVAPNLMARCQIVHADEVVAMDESPSSALRQKKKSSLRIAINQVKEGAAQACVSAGNTGALMATARFVLKTLPGIDRPAIVSSFPASGDEEHSTYMLDLGATVDTTAEQLVQFAAMGSVLSHFVGGTENPRVGVLNVGVEDIKGNETVRQVDLLLRNQSILNYTGYVEGNAIFKNIADVIICGGFVGNVVLKSIEGVVKLIVDQVRSAAKRSWFLRYLAIPAYPLLKRVKQKIDPDRRNGALLLGLNGTVVKSHGHASVDAYSYAIKVAIQAAATDIPSLIREQVALVLKELPNNGKV